MVKFHYLSRIFSAYVLRRNSQLTFWHGRPEVNENAFSQEEVLGEYYMPFVQKAHYPGPFDASGIPVLNYRGKIGKQKNPIAIAQYGLGNVNLYLRTREDRYLKALINVADWLSDNLIENRKGIPVWLHHFNFEYVQLLRKPWYSGLAQGQGISMLLRAFVITGNNQYLESADRAFIALEKTLSDGGTLFEGAMDSLWIEEYITMPPTHILNGFIWAIWGVYDYMLVKQDAICRDIYSRLLQTLLSNLKRYDCGYWSLYDLTDLKIPNLASPFYHALHIVQLDIMCRLTGERKFMDYSRKWAEYRSNWKNRLKAFCGKIAFKLMYF